MTSEPSTGSRPEGSSSIRRTRRWLGRLGLLVGGLLVGVLLAEVLARIVSPEGGADLLFNASDGSPPGLYLQDAELLSVPATDFSGEVVGLGRTVSIRTNEHGLRGPPLGPLRGHRWIAVGDSFTMAAQVEEEETFLALLQAQTGQEVLNAGVDGYSTWQAARRYIRLDREVESDRLLLVFFLGNDIFENQTFPERIRGARNIQPGQPVLRAPVSGRTLLLLRHSYLHAHWRVWSRRDVVSRGDDPIRDRWRQELGLFHAEGRAAMSRELRETYEALGELKERVQQRGDRLLVAIAPPAFAVEQERAEERLGQRRREVPQQRLRAPVGAPVQARHGRVEEEHLALRPQPAAPEERVRGHRRGQRREARAGAPPHELPERHVAVDRPRPQRQRPQQQHHVAAEHDGRAHEQRHRAPPPPVDPFRQRGRAQRQRERVGQRAAQVEQQVELRAHDGHEARGLLPAELARHGALQPPQREPAGRGEARAHGQQRPRLGRALAAVGLAVLAPLAPLAPLASGQMMANDERVTYR